MTRAALSLPPTFGSVNNSQDAYLPILPLRKLAGVSNRYWSFHSIPTTVALPGNRYAKSLHGFQDHQSESKFRELLSEYAEWDVHRPTGYADIFHHRFQSPRVNWSTNVLLAPYLAGGWQAALTTGIHAGRFYRYDMRSAYLWAGSLGMPDTRTYRRCLQPWKKGEGLYRVKLTRAVLHAPFPFNQAKECLATSREIETYNLPIGEVVDGISWKNTTDPTRMIDAVQLVSTWKQAGRSYWGRWGQAQKIACHANGKIWYLPNTSLNIPWAHEIISRVKMRLWECARDALHVYIDSVITPHRLPTGDKMGDWRLEKTYNGIFIRGPGQYGAPYDDSLERYAGVPHGSPLRNTTVAMARAR